MLLDSIEATHFRNLSGKIFWGPHLNIIFGNNGQGKTNWLEAIYLLGRSKSFRTPRLQEVIAFGQASALVSGKITAGTALERELQVALHSNTKSLLVNGKREPVARYLTQLQVFSFTADDLEVVRGNPEARRRFVDRGIVSLLPAYLKTLSDYTRVIKQKNKLLQSANESEFSLERTQDLLSPWNDQLVRLGHEIHRARIGYVERLNLTLEKQLFDRRALTIRYLSALAGKGDLNDYETLLRQRLHLRMNAELAAGRSLLGPHRDDLEILLDNREIRIYGSAGQQRSALLLLDLAAISLYNSGHDDYPLFIIDDVDAELDERRIKDLLDYLEGRTQTFITTSKRSHVEGFLSRANLYEIADGKVRNGSGESDALPKASGFV
ncbi:MAG TPA: DNA replication and repair protein RecF [Pyrinomonadaceae bacterium]|nr:DNA replication and repair protein RecF [Pyrinomonadaceae bacterium]